MRALASSTLISLLLASLPAPAFTQAGPADGPAGRWKGSLSFRGDAWPVRLHVESEGDACSARLDLPALVMAREPVDAVCVGGGLAVEMPFGLGTFELEPVADDSLRAARALGGDTATLALGADHERAPRRVDLTIESDGARLAAALLLPPGSGPHPAVLLLHGSAPMGRQDWEYRSWADLLARRGVASLYYDKRGVGGSTGEGESASFEDLTGDALAALDSLLSRPEIDGDRIGLSGGSQAGWIALSAASRSDDVGFLILRSAPAVTPAEQEEQSVVHRLRRDGVPEEHVQNALAHTRLFFYVVRTGEGWQELESSSRRGAEEGWGESVQRPRAPADLLWWREHHDFDPLPLIRELEIPTLLLYGGVDPIVPPALNAPIFRAAVPAATPVRVEVFPFADHGLEIGAGPVESENWRFPHKPDRMFEALSAWLAEHVTGGEAGRTGRGFSAHVERLVPVLLDSTGVPGAAVGVLVNGGIESLRGFGAAAPGSGSPVTPRTVFNAGSISKLLTAWGVLRLVESGRVDLDVPVNRYLRRWRLRSDALPVEEVTVRRLLSHTSGLSLETVPEYAPDEKPPSLVEALGDAERGPVLVAPPGAGYRYSGGGYMVLELLVEEMTGRDFAEYMREEVLRPLGMDDSGFAWRDPMRERAATPYENGRPVPYFRYVGRAAASLNTTVRDLVRLASVTVSGDVAESVGAGLLRPETVALMLSPQPETEQLGGAIRNGLGYALWGLADGSWSAGHAGQNTGWAGVVWLIPASGDGLVVLTNASTGRALWRWVLCDWATWAADTRWRGLCTDRPDWLPPPPEPRATGRARLPFGVPAQVSLPEELERDLVEVVAATLDSVPAAGMAVGVVVGDGLVFARGFGVADLETRARITPGTLFQVGSISKSFTATLAARLAGRGALDLEDRLARHLPHAELPDSLITLRHLAEHTSGLPRDAPGLRRRHDDYPVLAFTHFELYRGLAEAGLAFEPGDDWSYSNFGYGVLGHALEVASGTPFEVLLEREIFEPLGMEASTVTIWPELADRLATPHYMDEGRLVEYTPWDPEALSPASGVASTLRDMGRYVAFQIRAGRAGGAVGRLQAPRTVLNPELSYGTGWFVEPLPGVDTVVSVGGDLDGYVAEIAFSPRHGIGTIVLANTDPAGPVQQIGRWLLASLRAAEDPEAAREARYRRGMIHQALREWSEAARRFAELTSGVHPHLPSLYQLGRTGALSGVHLHAAQRALERYLAGEPLPTIPREAARWRLGMVYERMGRCEDAGRAYRAAAEAGYEPARDALAALSC